MTGTGRIAAHTGSPRASRGISPSVTAPACNPDDVYSGAGAQAAASNGAATKRAETNLGI
jgi:hypothetical protein